MAAGHIKLTELVDFAHLQQLQDSFSDSTRLSSIIVDQNGSPITRISNRNALCKLLHGESEQTEICLCFAGRSPATLQEPATFTCPYSGFSNVFVPFIYGGQHIASWVLFQVRVDDPSDALLHKTADEFMQDVADVKKALQHCPAFTERQLQDSIKYLQTLIRSMLAAAKGEHPGLLPGEGKQKANIEHTVTLINRFMGSDEISMFVCDYDTGKVLMLNQQYANWLGMPREEILGVQLARVEGQDFDAGLATCSAERMLDEGGVPKEPYQWNDYSALHSSWVRCTNQVVYWLDGRLAHLVTFRDITDERRMQDELSRLAYYDSQMNLPNALRLGHDIRGLIEKGRTTEDYLVCFDITALRRINDAHGRKTGDGFLRTVIKWIEHQNFANSVIYRIEGDEFCLRLMGVDAQRAIRAADIIHTRFADLWALVVNGQQVSVMSGVSISVIGVSSLNESDELQNVIERTLDFSRKEKKVVVYDEDTDRELKHQIQLQLSLKKCVRQDMRGFEVYFQPIVEPKSGLWKGLEALCRWQSPDVGSVPPMVFIREAEQLGFINVIGEWVLETSIRQCKAWGLDKLEGFFLSVNLSPIQIMSTSLVSHTVEMLEQYDYPGAKLSLEVTESTRVNFNDEHTLHVIEKLRGYGVMFALDDFGTGYSSFNNLKNLPVRFVKTDHTFIKGIEKDYFMQYFYHIITELAHKTNMRLVVEGIETVEQLEIMLQNGVDYLQGYFFGRPMPPEDMEQKLIHFTQPQKAMLPSAADGCAQPTKREETSSYLITTHAFNLQTQCMQLLLGNTPVAEALDEVLKLTGEYLGANRGYIFEKIEGTVFRFAHIWREEDTPVVVNSDMLDIGLYCPEWLELLKKEGIIRSSKRSLLPDRVREMLRAHNSGAALVLPLRNGEHISGFIGFDCTEERNWQPEEVILLRNLGLLVENRLRLESRKPQKHRTLHLRAGRYRKANRPEG